MRPMEAAGGPDHRRRLTRFYFALAAFVVVGFVAAFAIGDDREAEADHAGHYELGSPSGCLGRSFDLRQSGQFAWISSPDGAAGGSLRVSDGEFTGTVECANGDEQTVDLRAAAGRIEGRVGTKRIRAVRTADEPPPESQATVRPSGVTGMYSLAPSSSCLGSEIELEGSSDDLQLDGAGRVSGQGTYENGTLRGTARCADGTRAEFSGEAAERKIQLEVTPLTKPSGPARPERIEASEQREFSATVAAFLAALIVVMAAARLCGELAVRIKQPRVMGEVVSGIVLGPTVLGALAPGVQAAIFPSDLILVLGVVANLGVVLYMFMVGIEIDIALLRSRIGHAVAVSNGSVAIPMVLGVLAAIPTYELVGPDVGFAGFALFMGVAMSITAFPVLARILDERGMLRRPIGATAMAAAAIDDVTAWFLIALATAFAAGGSGAEIGVRIVLALAFFALMFFAVRPLLARAFAASGSETRLSPTWLAVVLGGALLSAYVTEEIGVAVIFGAFVMGLIMPRDTELTKDASRRIEDLVVLVLLPVFFAYTGLRTNVALLDSWELWVLAGGLLLVAIAGKFGGAMLAARVSGMGWRRSAVLGTLMNTRGLTELIALNLALDLGVISEALFTALVLMALVTTFMAGPLLRLFDPRNTLGSPQEPETPGPPVRSPANA